MPGVHLIAPLLRHWIIGTLHHVGRHGESVFREPNGEPNTATPTGLQRTVTDWFTHGAQVIGLSANAQPEPPISPSLNPP